MPKTSDNNARSYRFEDFHLIPDEHLLLRSGKRVTLSPRLFALLTELVKNAGHLLDKETLMNEVWSDSVVEEGNLNRTISNLRKVLGEKPNENIYIETIPRVGYRFIAPIEVVSRDHILPESKPARPSGMSNQSPWTLLIVILVFVAACVAFFLILRNSFVPPDADQTGSGLPGPVRLTDHPFDDSHPRWTKDGRIRFFRNDENRQGRSAIMNADGTAPAIVADLPGLQYGVWSPDGARVVFAKSNDKSSFYLANADGSNEVPLPFFAGNFDWSHDGRQIVFQKNVDDNSEIFVYSVSSGEARNITNSKTFDADPSFSPDAAKVVFVSDRDGNGEIYVMNSDGTGIKRLTNDPSIDSHPVFSPDGTQIAFTSDREGENADIYLMNADGGNILKLTGWSSSETADTGCWSPDGTKIAFFSDHKNGKDDDIMSSARKPFARKRYWKTR